MCLFQNQLKLILLISIFKKVDQTCVKSKDSTECCADFYFVDGACKPCEPGFFGPNCRATCPYPYYGHKCTEMCECPQDQCEVSQGCKHFSLQPNTATNPTPDQKPNKQVGSTTDKPFGNSSFLLIVILSSTSSLVISVVVITFVVFHRKFRSKGRQNSGPLVEDQRHRLADLLRPIMKLMTKLLLLIRLAVDKAM